MTPTPRADPPEWEGAAPAPIPVPDLDRLPAATRIVAGAPGPVAVPELELPVVAPLPVPSIGDGGPVVLSPVRRPIPRRLAAAIGVVTTVVVLVVGVAAAVIAPSATVGGHQATAFAAGTAGNRIQAGVHRSLHLPTATSAPAPAPPSVATAAPLQSHEVFGYAPYWTLPKSSGFDLADLTTLAYFSVDANADGTLDSEWPGVERLPEPGPGRPGHPGPRRR